MDSKKFDSLKPKVVLGVAAHPDDLDFGASGSIAKWAAEGADVYYLVLTDGSKGSSDRHISSADLIKIRQKEQRAAAKILGVKEVIFLGYEDGALTCNMDVKRDVTRVIRQVKPEVIVAFDPSMIYSVEHGFINHPDHRAAGQVALDACFPLARDHLSFPELLAEGLEPHNTSTVLLVNFEKNNYTVDISTTLDKKLQALAAHKSQIADTKKTYAMVKKWATESGKIAGTNYAEAFVRIDIR